MAMLRFYLLYSLLRKKVGGNAPFFGWFWTTLNRLGGNAPFFVHFLPILTLLNGNAPFFKPFF